ncbi:MAG TPA: hypothetical protein GX699_09760 [Firmicutes bacterium]|nr:hypothetical protein [Bacillota bacterium]
MMSNVELVFFMIFLTDVAKFSIPTVAIIGSVTSIVDLVLSPFYGAIISGIKPLKWGRNRSWMLIAPPAVVIFYMINYTKFGPSETMAAIIVCIGFILSHIIWNIAWVGNVSLIAVLANNADERALLASRRGFWTAVAGICFSYVGPPLAIWYARVTGNEVLGYTLVAGTMAMLMLIGYWTVFKITDGYEPTGEDAEAAAEPVSVKGMLRNLFQNPPLMFLVLADFCRYVAYFTVLSAASYYFKYIALNPGGVKNYLLLGGIAALVGSYFAAHLSKALSTRNASIVFSIICAVFMVIGTYLGLTSVVLFMVFAVAGRLFLGVTASTYVAMYSDAAIYGEWKTGENAAPFVMGMMTLPLKCAVFFRSLLIPLVLGAANYDANIDPAQATAAVKSAIMNINLMIPGVIAGLGGIILLVAYRLTRDRLNQIQAEVDARHAQVAK